MKIFSRRPRIHFHPSGGVAQGAHRERGRRSTTTTHCENNLQPRQILAHRAHRGERDKGRAGFRIPEGGYTMANPNYRKNLYLDIKGETSGTFRTYYQTMHGECTP